MAQFWPRYIKENEGSLSGPPVYPGLGGDYTPPISKCPVRRKLGCTDDETTFIIDKRGNKKKVTTRIVQGQTVTIIIDGVCVYGPALNDIVYAAGIK